MATLRQIPESNKGRAYRRVAWVVGIASVIGIADQIRTLFWLMVGGVPEGVNAPGVYSPRVLIMLAGWVLVCWCAILGVRKNAIPPAWALVSIPVMIWAVLLLPLAA